MKTTKERSSQIISKTKRIKKLRKKMVSLSLCFVMICSITFTLGFVLLKQNYNITTDFTDYTMQITDAKGIGLEKTENNQVRLVKQVENETQTFSTNTNDSYEEVSLKKENSDYEVKLGDLNAEIYKMKVVGNFTFVSYISKNIRKNCTKYYNYYIENSHGDSVYCKTFALSIGRIVDRLQGVPDNFDLVGYRNTDYIKSYIVDNLTGKIYSTAQFKEFSIQDDFIKVEYYNSGAKLYNYYKYFINDQGNLEIVELISNRDILVTYIHKAPDNVCYVFNKSINLYDSENKYYYININVLKYNEYFSVGSDNYLYLFTRYKYNLHKYVNGQLMPTELNNNMDFNIPKISESFNTKRFGIYSLNNNIGFISEWDNLYTEDSEIYNFETNKMIYLNENSQNLTFSKDDFMILLENNKVLIKRSSNVLSYADFNFETGEITNENILLNDCTLKIGETTLVNGVYKTLSYVITVTTTNETKIYEAEVVDNNVQLKLIEHEIAKGEVFVIEPIN